MKDQKKQIIENYVNSYNNLDINGLIKNLDKDVVFENISNGKVNLKTEGLIDFKKQAESAKKYFKKRKLTIESWNFSDNIVSINIDYVAILEFDVPNGPKSGDIIKLKGRSIFEFENGKIKKIKDES